MQHEGHQSRQTVQPRHRVITATRPGWCLQTTRHDAPLRVQLRGTDRSTSGECMLLCPPPRDNSPVSGYCSSSWLANGGATTRPGSYTLHKGFSAVQATQHSTFHLLFPSRPSRRSRSTAQVAYGQATTGQRFTAGTVPTMPGFNFQGPQKGISGAKMTGCNKRGLFFIAFRKRKKVRQNSHVLGCHITPLPGFRCRV